MVTRLGFIELVVWGPLHGKTRLRLKFRFLFGSKYYDNLVTVHMLCTHVQYTNDNRCMIVQCTFVQTPTLLTELGTCGLQSAQAPKFLGAKLDALFHAFGYVSVK